SGWTLLPHRKSRRQDLAVESRTLLRPTSRSVMEEPRARSSWTSGTLVRRGDRDQRRHGNLSPEAAWIRITGSRTPVALKSCGFTGATSAGRSTRCCPRHAISYAASAKLCLNQALTPTELTRNTNVMGRFL